MQIFSHKEGNNVMFNICWMNKKSKVEFIVDSVSQRLYSKSQNWFFKGIRWLFSTLLCKEVFCTLICKNSHFYCQYIMFFNKSGVNGEIFWNTVFKTAAGRYYALQTEKQTGSTLNTQKTTMPQKNNAFLQGKKHLKLLYLLPILQEGTNDLKFAIAVSQRWLSFSSWCNNS